MEKQKRRAALAVQSHQPPRVTLVCVTNQFECQRIIRSGRVIADITHTQLAVLSVTSPEYGQNPQALQYLYNVSRENNAEMTVTYSENPAKVIGSFLRENQVGCMLSGMPADESSLLYRIWNKFKHIKFFTVADDGEIQEAGRLVKTVSV